MYLSDFQILRPPYESTQEHALDWFVEAHTQAEKQKGASKEELDLFRKTIRERIWHVGCKPDGIAKRGHIVADYLHLDWTQMQIYSVLDKPGGVGLKERTQCFEAYVDKIFEEFYEKEESAPEEIIHVTCTGYIAPSGSQKLISKKNWGRFTTATNAYHMGCYASIPAIRMAKNCILSDAKTKRVDIVHTEICSLHSNPALHRVDQLISQSLFADGFIKYSATDKELDLCLKVLATKEELIAESTHAMNWNIADWGFEMSLTREVPVLIAKSLRGYLERLSSFQEQNVESLYNHAIFAVHPGGPKILSHVQKILSLSDWQMAHSLKILRDFGNMSSATLPHIWNAILKDQSIATQTPIVSLAFGPGLTLCGAIMEKRCG